MRYSTAEEHQESRFVENWLQAHPAFFQGREALLGQMQLNHPCGDAESLLIYQLHLLRQQVAEQDKQHQALLSNARDNDSRLRRIERLLLALLETDTTDDLTSVLAERLQSDFNLPHLRFWSYTNLNSLPRASETRQKKQQALLGKARQARCLDLDAKQRTLLGLDSVDAGSAVLCLLSHARPLGLMVLAHPSPLHFRDHLDTRFVEYLSSVISRLLSKDRRQFRAEAAD